MADFKLDGAVYGLPIVVDGRTFVATENDSVYAFDSAYRQIWKRTSSKPSPQSERLSSSSTSGFLPTRTDEGPQAALDIRHDHIPAREWPRADLQCVNSVWP